MKVVCDGCQAKYQVADDKVAGRKLKIRCRKCSRAIVVRGDQLVVAQVAASRSAALAQPKAAPVVDWHVSLGGEPHGPYPHEQMLEMLAAGQLSWDAHVWREGYPNWCLARESQTLVTQVQGSVDLGPAPATSIAAEVEDGPTRVTHEEDATRTYQSESFAAGDRLRPKATQAFATAARSAPRMRTASGIQRAESAAVDEVGLKARVERMAASVREAPVQRAHPRVDLAHALTGERHEDSVLFSANNLTASAATTAPTAATARGGYASGEGSGLIDIRALAALTTQGSGRPAPAGASFAKSAAPQGPAQDNDIERWSGLAHQTGAFANLDSLAPIDHPPSRGRNTLPVAIVVGAAVLSVTGFAAAVVLFKPAPPEAPAVVAAAAALSPEPSPAVAPELQAAPVEAVPSEPAPVEVEEEQVEAEANPVVAAALPSAAPRPRAAAAKRRQSAAESKAVAGAKAKAATEEAPAPEPSAKVASLDDVLLEDKPSAKPATSAAASSDLDLLGASPTPAAGAAAKPDPKAAASNRSIDDLLSTAVASSKESGSKPQAPSAEGAASDLPASPSRAQVLSAMRGVEAAVRACAEPTTKGTASVALTVMGATGRVSGVNVTGIQGAVGSCIARAVRSAEFSPFSKTDFKVNYPYRF